MHSMTMTGYRIGTGLLALTVLVFIGGYVTYGVRCTRGLRTIPCLAAQSIHDAPSSVFEPFPTHIMSTVKEHTEFTASQMQKWQDLNPMYSVRVFDDTEASDYLGHRAPWALDMFAQLKGPIKADVFRIVWLYNEGGVYTDIDVVPAVPVSEFGFDSTVNDTWIPMDHNFAGMARANPTVMIAMPRASIVRSSVETYRRLSYVPFKRFLYWDLSVVNVITSLMHHGHADKVDTTCVQINPQNIVAEDGHYQIYFETQDTHKRLFWARHPDWDFKAHKPRE